MAKRARMAELPPCIPAAVGGAAMEGVISNLPRLDIRLGLMAAAANRQADPDRLRTTLPGVLDARRLAYCELDGASFDPAWILTGFPP